MHNLSYLRVMSMGGHFFQNMNLPDNVFFTSVSVVIQNSFQPNLRL